MNKMNIKEEIIKINKAISDVEDGSGRASGKQTLPQALYGIQLVYENDKLYFSKAYYYDPEFVSKTTKTCEVASNQNDAKVVIKILKPLITILLMGSGRL